MQATAQIAIPTPLLDKLRPWVLEALRVRGWERAFTQHDNVFTVRAKRDLTGKRYSAILTLTEIDGDVVPGVAGDGHVLLVSDLCAEGVMA